MNFNARQHTGAGDAFGLTKNTAEVKKTSRRRSTDRPASQVTVEDGTVDSQESREVKTHAESASGAINELLNGGNTVVRQVAAVLTVRRETDKAQNVGKPTGSQRRSNRGKDHGGQ